MERGTIEVAPLAFMRGRAQPVSTPVLTPEGFRPIGDLQSAISSSARTASRRRCSACTRRAGQQVFRVHTQDGASTLCCAEHLWHVYTASTADAAKPGRVLETQEMIGRLRAFHQHRFELPVVSAPVEFEHQPVPMDPYALGLLLGDGCITTKTTPSFSTHDPELARALEDALDGIELDRAEGRRLRPPDVHGHRARRDRHEPGDRGPARARSRRHDVEHEVRPRELPLQFAGGAARGPARSARHRWRARHTAGRSCRVSYTTCSERLRDDVLFLVRSLGGVAYWRCRPAEGRRARPRERSPRPSSPRRVHPRHSAAQ